MTIPRDKNGCCVECGEDDIHPHGPNCSAWCADGSPPKRGSCGNILRAFHGNDYACDRERAHDGDHSHGSSYSMIGWTEPMGNPIVTRVPEAIAEVWNSTMRQLFDARYPGTPDEPPVKPLPPDYATTYRGFDERVRKIVAERCAEMRPAPKIVTDIQTSGSYGTLVLWLESGTVKLSRHWAVPPNQMPYWWANVEESVGEAIRDLQLEIGRRGTR